MKRAFRVAEGRTVTLPQGLRAGPGATNLRLAEGEKFIVDLSGDRAQFSRFVNGRKAAGDVVELKLEEVPADQDGVGAGASLVPDPNRAPPGDTGLAMARPTSAGSIANTGRRS